MYALWDLVKDKSKTKTFMFPFSDLRSHMVRHQAGQKKQTVWRQRPGFTAQRWDWEKKAEHTRELDKKGLLLLVELNILLLSIGSVRRCARGGKGGGRKRRPCHHHSETAAHPDRALINIHVRKERKFVYRRRTEQPYVSPGQSQGWLFYLQAVAWSAGKWKMFFFLEDKHRDKIWTETSFTPLGEILAVRSKTIQTHLVLQMSASRLRNNKRHRHRHSQDILKLSVQYES